MVIETNLPHVLFVLLVLSRVGDVVSTRLATPTLALEANPVVHRLGWRFALVTLLLPFIAYYSTALALMALVPSLMVTTSNLSKGWLIRTMGEKPYRELLLKLARESRVATALGFAVAASATMMLAGATLVVLENSDRWGYWFGLGVVTYGLAMGVHGSAFIVRLFRTAKAPVASG